MNGIVRHLVTRSRLLVSLEVGVADFLCSMAGSILLMAITGQGNISKALADAELNGVICAVVWFLFAPLIIAAELTAAQEWTPPRNWAKYTGGISRKHQAKVHYIWVTPLLRYSENDPELCDDLKGSRAAARRTRVDVKDSETDRLIWRAQTTRAKALQAWRDYFADRFNNAKWVRANEWELKALRADRLAEEAAQQEQEMFQRLLVLEHQPLALPHWRSEDIPHNDN